MDTPDLPPERSAPPPIPSLELLGDRLEVAAARSIEGRAAGRRRADGSLLAGGRGPWRLALIPAVGVAAVVALLVVVFVNGGTTPLPAEAAMVQAADRTAALPTGRFSMRIDVSGSGGASQGVTLVGAYDEGKGQLRAEADLSGMLFGPEGGQGGAAGDATKMEVIIDHDTGYLRSVALQTVFGSETPWFSVDAHLLETMFGRGSDAALPPASGPSTTATTAAAPSVPFSLPGLGTGSLASPLPMAADPSALLDLVRHAGGNVQLVGAERIDGADMSHYRARTRLADAVAQLDPDAQESVRSLLAAAGDEVQRTEVPIDVWVGADGLVRRISIQAVPGAGGAASLTVDYLDPGRAVDIVIPPNASKDLGPLLAGALGQVLGNGSPAPRPKSPDTIAR